MNSSSSFSVGLGLGALLLLAMFWKSSSSSPSSRAAIRPPPLPHGLTWPFSTRGTVSPMRGIPLELTTAMAELSKPMEDDQPTDRIILRMAPEHATHLANRALDALNCLLDPQAHLNLIVTDSAVLTSAGLTRVLFTAHSLASNVSLKLLAIFGTDSELAKLSLASEALSGPSADSMPPLREFKTFDPTGSLQA